MLEVEKEEEKLEVAEETTDGTWVEMVVEELGKGACGAVIAGFRSKAVRKVEDVGRGVQEGKMGADLGGEIFVPIVYIKEDTDTEPVLDRLLLLVEPLPLLSDETRETLRRTLLLFKRSLTENERRLRGDKGLFVPEVGFEEALDTQRKVTDFTS